METAEKTLPKHLKAAVNQLQKQIDKLQKEVDGYVAAAKQAQEMSTLKVKQMVFLQEQIAKLKEE